MVQLFFHRRYPSDLQLPNQKLARRQADTSQPRQTNNATPLQALKLEGAPAFQHGSARWRSSSCLAAAGRRPAGHSTPDPRQAQRERKHRHIWLTSARRGATQQARVPLSAACACPAGVSGRTRVFLDKSSVNAGQRSVNGRSTLGQRWPPKTRLPGGFVSRRGPREARSNKRSINSLEIGLVIAAHLLVTILSTNPPGRSVFGGQR